MSAAKDTEAAKTFREHLLEGAETFGVYAEDQRAMQTRSYYSKSQKAEMKIRAEVWDSAADQMREWAAQFPGPSEEVEQ